MARRHPEPGDAPLLSSLTEERIPADNSQHYAGAAARWYGAIYAWKTDDIPFYQAQAERWAGPGGSVLELGCGDGRVTLPLARAGYRVLAVDSSEAMLEQDVFTPDPARLVDDPDWAVDIEVEADDPGGEGQVHVLRECLRRMDFGRQVMHIRFRNRISRGEVELAEWEEEVDLAYIFPRELELILERQGFHIKDRFGGAEGQPYEPAPGLLQQQFVVAQLVP